MNFRQRIDPVLPICSSSSALILAVVLAACGGGGSEDPPGNSGGPGSGGTPGSGTPVPTYSVGGSVTGMTGTGMKLLNNALDELTLDSAGNFVFDTELEDGDDYDIEITEQPANPDNVCTIDNPSGTIASADVNNVQILCTGPLLLIDTAPQDGDENVSRAIRPVLTFSADIEPGTAIPDNLLLTSDAGDVAAGIDVVGAEITLSPEHNLLPLTVYEIAVATDIEGIDGERLLDRIATSFTTRDASWQADIPIDAANGPANDAQVLFDRDGNALAVWYQEAHSRTDLWSNYYMAGVGWGTAELVEHNDVDLYAGSPRAGFDDEGNALLVWTQTEMSTGGNVWSSRFVPQSGWTTPELVETRPGAVLGLVEMAMNGDGDAVAVWAQFDGTDVNVWANRFTTAGGWGAAEIIDATNAIVDRPRVAIGENGDALAVWEQSRGTPFDIWGNRFTNAGGWQVPDLISTGNVGTALSPRPAIDADGNALVVYDQDNGFDRGVYANRQTINGGWETPIRIGLAEGGHEQQLAFDSDGNALVVWEQPVMSGGRVVINTYASRFASATGWDSAVSISSGDVFYPKIAFDASGHALAVWFELDLTLPLPSAYSVWGNRYTNGSGWTSPEQIGSNGTLIGTFMPNLAIDPSGDAFAIWTRAGDVRVNRFE